MTKSVALFDIPGDESKDESEDKNDINYKERFGEIPKSIMKFKKDKELMELIGWDDNEMGKVADGGSGTARGGGYAKNLRYSIYNPVQAKFILEYYTRKGYKVLDPFSGRGTRPICAMYTDREYVGYDTCQKTIDFNTELLIKSFPSKTGVGATATKIDWTLCHGDGTVLQYHDDAESFDAVFSCPPYYNIEKYSGEAGDLSHVSKKQFDESIENMFVKLHKLVKTSSYKDKKFHPVIFTVGSVRMGEEGLIDMDANFQAAAKKAGFVLYDKLFTENLAPGAGFTFRRNYENGFVCKNYETTLVFNKF